VEYTASVKNTNFIYTIAHKNRTHDIYNKHQPADNRRIQHTTSHATLPHVSTTHPTSAIEIKFFILDTLIQIFSSHRDLDAPTHQQRNTDIARRLTQGVDPSGTCTLPTPALRATHSHLFSFIDNFYILIPLYFVFIGYTVGICYSTHLTL
jgi:hypothetical protein